MNAMTKWQGRDHLTCARLHARRRLWERHGVAMNEGEQIALERRLVAGEFEWAADLAGFAVAFAIPLRPGLTVYAVFSIALWAIVTFLPSLAWVRRKAIRSA
ncbi:MAG: hypothetical protein IPK59_03950 [Rhodospirillaceae bacterium]|nr:hypothetical protein [Rhodospirillaceae bacterium]